jgi:hypothetical protein
VLVLQILGARALAVSTMADWVGRNNSPATNTFDSQVFGATNVSAPTDENFVIVSPTSIGGQVQAKVNYNFDPNNKINEDPNEVVNVNYPHLYLADQSLEGTLDFTTPLHMQGTISFDTPSDVGIEPNFCFCWYNSTDTRHRIGLGISNTVETGFTAQPDSLRIDLGYAATGGNKFYYVTADGTLDQNNGNSRLPDGTYQFTFDYTPGPLAGGVGGSVSATVTDATHNYHFTRTPLETQPYDPISGDFFALDRFGIIIRSTSGAVRNGKYNLSISNVTYTGGTDFVQPAVSGDYNNNGVVDAADYVLWRNGGPLANEVDAPGTVNAADYTEWKARFGNTSGSGSGLGTGAVPEPASALLTSLAGLAAVALVRRRGR